MLQQKHVKTRLNYLYEIKYRSIHTTIGILWTFIISYSYRQTIIYILLPNGISNILSTDITEIFRIYLNIAYAITIILGGMILIIQILLFLRPGLYHTESQSLLITIGTLIGVSTAIYVGLYPQIIQICWDFFSAYSKNFKPVQLNFEPHLLTYINHISGIGLLLTISGIILIGIAAWLLHTSINTLISHRKIIHFVTIIFATVITPPDPISQIFISATLIFLYELYMMLKLIQKKYFFCINSASNQN